MWSEFSGPIARSPTLSFNDPIGFAAVAGAAQQFQQLDSVLGAEGFVKAVEAQLNNQSLPRTEPPHANWAGLLSFLPQLAELAGPVLKGAFGGAMKSMGYKDMNKKAPPVQRAPPPPPRRESLRKVPTPPPPPPPRRAAPLQSQLQAGRKNLKRR